MASETMIDFFSIEMHVKMKRNGIFAIELRFWQGLTID